MQIMRVTSACVPATVRLIARRSGGAWMPPCVTYSRSESVLIACDGIGCGAYQACPLGSGMAGEHIHYHL